MVSAGDFRNGVTFEMDGQVYQIVEFQHVKPGKALHSLELKSRMLFKALLLKEPLTQRKNSQLHLLKEKIWFIHIMIPVFITLWIRKHLI